MGDNNDESKYLEGNYSANNPFKAVKEWWEDTKQAQELQNAEEYFEAYMQYLKDKKDEHHYLVDGSVLTCTRCTVKPQTPLDKEFTAPEGSNEVILKVTMQDRYKNAAEQLFATIKDSKKFDNIEPFGNCLNPPDRDDERKALELAGESEELRKLGTCRYLMQLNDEWENLISDVGYQEVTGLDNISLEEITMESILFCKHGGFIYPIDSGYIQTDVVVEEEEKESEKKYVLNEPVISDPQAVKEYMWNFFCDKGLSEVTVAGILGNVKRECEFDLQWAAQINPNRFGLFQWSSNTNEARRAAFDKWAESENRDVNLISTQCEYAYIEMTTGGMFTIILDANDNNPSDLICNYETLINADTPEEAARIFATSFERCYVSYREGDNGQMHYSDIQHSYDRQYNAREIYDDMSQR